MVLVPCIARILKAGIWIQKLWQLENLTLVVSLELERLLGRNMGKYINL